jgi:hypothetical protein
MRLITPGSLVPLAVSTKTVFAAPGFGGLGGIGNATGRYVSPQLVQIIKRAAQKMVAMAARTKRTTLIDTPAELCVHSQQIFLRFLYSKAALKNFLF